MVRFLRGFSFLAVLLLSACGMKELGESEKAQFKKASLNLGRVTNAVYDSTVAAETRDSVYASDTLSVSLRKAIRKSIADKTCVVPVPAPTRLAIPVLHAAYTPHLGEPQSSRFTVEGASCPISMEVSTSVDGNSSKGGAKIHLKLKVNHPDLIAVAEMDALEIEGKALWFMNGTRYQTSSLVDASLDLTGKVHSPKDGDIKVYWRVSNAYRSLISGRKTFEGEYLFGMGFKSFTGEFKWTSEVEAKTGGKSTSKVSYFLNDRKIGPDEISSFAQTQLRGVLWRR